MFIDKCLLNNTFTIMNTFRHAIVFYFVGKSKPNQ